MLFTLTSKIIKCMKPLLKVETYTSESLPHEPVITNMENNIQTIIDKFDEQFKCINDNCNSYGTRADYIGEEVEAYQCQYCETYLFPQRQFLKDSLTSILDGILLELPKEKDAHNYNDINISFNNCRQEVINIINSHR